MKKLMFAMIIVLILSVGNAFGFGIKLGWDTPDHDPDLIKGYEVCYGLSSGQYDSCVSVDGYHTNEIDIDGLTDEVMHYFAARTLGWNGSKSGFSSEVRTDGFSLPSGGWTPDAPDSCFIITVY